MSDTTVAFTIDDVEVKGAPGQTIMQAADAAGIYIPRLCAFEGLARIGSCRLCTVLVNGRPQAACVQPVAAGLAVENDTPYIRELRKNIVEMMFVEGNHFCMFCEKSGNCELQAMAYRFGIMSPRHPFLFPKRDVDASHPDVMIDHNRCIQCGRCVAASRDLDGKAVFEFVGRGDKRKLAVSAAARLSESGLAVTDRAVDVCPTGALLKKRVGFAVPMGQRLYDHTPIGSGVENKTSATS
jgi:[NiFe] hydrogenase diaphorase moiety small subunit